MKNLDALVLEFDEMGAISDPPIAEVYAGLIAEGEDAAKAWKSAGGAQSVKSVALKAALDASPEFQARLEVIRQVRAEQLKDPLFGEAITFINLAYRDARQRRHREDIMEYVKLRLRASESSANFRMKVMGAQAAAAPAETSEPTAKRPVGKPPADSPQSNRSTSALRQGLMDKGVKNLPEPEEGEDEVAVH